MRDIGKEGRRHKEREGIRRGMERDIRRHKEREGDIKRDIRRET